VYSNSYYDVSKIIGITQTKIIPTLLAKYAKQQPNSIKTRVC
jgi:hypothetical protein